MGELVSVIIPCYNGAPYLGEAIESALAQTWMDVEVVVINDGSTDDTPAVARRYGNRIRLVEQDNRGVATARNAGIASATGEYLAFLDADDRWEPEKLTKQVAALAASPDAVLCHTGVISFESDGTVRPDPLARSATATGTCWDVLCEGNRVCVSSVLCVRRAVEEAGGFRTHVPGCEDYDLWLRLAHRYPFCFVSEYLVWYRRSPNQLSRRRALMARSRDRALGDFLEHIRDELPEAEWAQLARRRDEALMEDAMDAYWTGDFAAARTLLGECMLRPCVAAGARRYYHLSRYPRLVRVKWRVARWLYESAPRPGREKGWQE